MNMMATTNPTLSAQLQEKLNAVVNYPSGIIGASQKHTAPVVLSDDSSRSQESGRKSAEGEGKTTYRDYSRVLPEKHNQASSLIAQSTTAKEPTFPVKLHMILSNPEYQDIISWLPHGRSWRILQQKAFEERVIPLYFRHGRYSSFARQVNGWGFRRITHGSDYNSYYHELFLRGMPHLCDKMRRLTSKDIEKRKKIDEEPAPDFYTLSRDNPLPESAPLPSSAISAPSATIAQTSPAPAPVRVGHATTAAEVELALLDRRRADILDRMNCLATSKALMPEQAIAQSPLGLQGLNQVGNLSSFMGVPNVLLNPAEAAFQRQMLGARLVNSDVAKLLALQNPNLAAINQGLMGNPYGL